MAPPTHSRHPLRRPSFARVAFVVLWLFFAKSAAWAAAAELPPDNRQLRSIFNNDADNILYAMDSAKTAAEIVADYRAALEPILEARPGVFAQNVGNPDPVIYRSRVATPWSKYVGGHSAESMTKMVAAGTDPLQVTIEECRSRGVPIIVSYRMNAEDFYEGELKIQDFARQYPQLVIPGAFCLDPLHPAVYQHRMAIFREVAENYDIDGIEFDFRRWTHMVSDPLNNHPVLTRMVRETRAMLQEVARKKGRRRLLLGARVGPSLTTPQAEAKYAGASEKPTELSCRELGLDVKTWVESGLVDYLSPTLFWPDWPGLPRTREFVDLARNHPVGIYPTLFPRPEWLNDSVGKKPRGPIQPGDTDKLTDYKQGLTTHALQAYADGADGLSTYNWYFHLHLSRAPRQWQNYYGYGMGGSLIQKRTLSLLGNPQGLRAYAGEERFWPVEDDRWLEHFRLPEREITVRNPGTLPEMLAVERLPVGLPGDYKPMLAQLPDGELLMILFHSHRVSEAKNPVREDVLVSRFRAKDNQWSWPERVPLLGREPYLTVLRDGTLLATTALLAEDVRNVEGYTHACVHRSVDGGRRWSSVQIDASQLQEPFASSLPQDRWTVTSRNILETADGTLLMGVSSGRSHDFLWRSRDRGVHWEKPVPVTVHGFDVRAQDFPWFSEMILWQCPQGDLLGIARCHPSALQPLPGTTLPTGNDQIERMAVFRSRDGGLNWHLEPELGSTYGEHYPSLLRLADRRLLLTFTVRALAPPLGVQAVLGRETPAGFQFDFQSDRMVIDRATPVGAISGGGFGNTVQLQDGSLMTAYSYRDARGLTHLETARYRLP